MKTNLACHPNSFGRFGPRAAIDHLAELGIRQIEFPIKTFGVNSPFGETPLLTDASPKADIVAITREVERAGLSICSCNITSGNPLQEKVLAATLTKLEMAADLGVDLVVAGAGEFQNPDEEQTLLDHLTQIGDRCEALGLEYCCETHPGACQNAESMLRLMSQLQHPQIRINFDTANILFYNQDLDVCQELQRVLPFVKHVHLKDSRGIYRDWYFPALGEGGAVDFVGLRKILEESGFAGPCSLEVEGIQGEPEMTLTQHCQRVEKSVQFLRGLGYDWDSPIEQQNR